MGLLLPFKLSKTSSKTCDLSFSTVARSCDREDTTQTHSQTSDLIVHTHLDQGLRELDRDLERFQLILAIAVREGRKRTSREYSLVRISEAATDRSQRIACTSCLLLAVEANALNLTRNYPGQRRKQNKQGALEQQELDLTSLTSMKASLFSAGQSEWKSTYFRTAQRRKIAPRTFLPHLLH